MINLIQIALNLIFTMKIIPFQIPKSGSESFKIQKDELPYFYDKLHQHPEIQITLILKGEGTLIAGNSINHFKTGSLYVIGSNVPHVFRSDNRFYQQDQENGCEGISLYFESNFGGSSFINLPEMNQIRTFYLQPGFAYSIEGNSRFIVSEELVEIERSTGFDRLIHFLQILYFISQSVDLKSLSIAREYKNYNEKEGKRMNDVLQFTFKESNRQISIEEVAEIAHLTPEAFCRFFKLRTRKTYINFLNEVRVNNACKLLINKEESISEICFKTGFNNLSNFNRIFKKLTNHSPGQYRKTGY